MAQKKKSGKKQQQKSKRSYRVRSTGKITPELSNPATLEQLLKNNPADLDAALQLAEYYYKSNQETRIPDVLNSFDHFSIKSGSKKRFRHLTLLAIGYAFSRELSEAEQISEQGLKEFPDSLDFYYILSFIKLSLREYSSAIEHGHKYLQLLRTKPVLDGMPWPLCGMMAHLSQLQNIVGNAYREQSKTEEAVKHYNASMEADTGNHLPYLNLATTYSHLGKFSEAKSIISKGLTSCVQVHELRMLEQSLNNNRTISACMIVKDEAALLPGCLESIRSWVNEIIVVDTGSNDNTVSIAMSYGAKVFNQQWEGDFSKHRNFSIEQATSDWVFIIDADERMCEEDVSRLKEVINSDEHSIVSINVFNVYSKSEKITTFLPSIRFFRRDLNLRYEGIVHNRLIFPENATIVRANIKLKHLGYDLSPELMRKKFERSHALLEKQLQKHPNDAFALFNLAQLLRGAGKDNPDLFSAEIINLASKAVALTNPQELSSRNIHLMCLDQLGWAYFYKGDLKQALLFARRALTHKPDYLDPLLLLGHIYSQSKEYEQAASAYHRYIEIQVQYDPTAEKDNIILVNPDSRATAYYGLGLLAQREENFTEARRYYNKTIELNPEYLDVQERLESITHSLSQQSVDFALGAKCLDEQDYLGAEKHFQQAIESALNKRRVTLEIAQTYFDKSLYLNAANYFQKWLDTSGADSEITNDLANCYFNLNEYEKAKELYETAAKLPNAPVTIFRNLGLTCSILKQFGHAIIAFRRYLEVHRDDSEIISIMADLCLKTGDFKSAMPHYEKALRLNPSDYAAIFNLSECYLNLGHEESARIGYRRVLELNSDFEFAKKRLSQLDEVSTALS